MTLSVHNQLRLLQDLLDEQQLERTGSVAEYQQIKRLVHSILSQNSTTDEQLLQLLPEIYLYGQKGESTRNQPQHIMAYKADIGHWINAIRQSNLE